MAKPEEYGVSVRLIQDNGSEMYEARVLELPDVRTYGESYSDAYGGAIEVIRTTQQIFAEKGRPFPEVAVQEDEFSGRITLRMSKSLHRSVHERAQRDCISLNQWVVEAVASRIDGTMIPASSVFVVSPVKPEMPGRIGMQLQQAQHLISLGSAANIFLLEPIQDTIFSPKELLNIVSPALTMDDN